MDQAQVPATPVTMAVAGTIGFLVAGWLLFRAVRSGRVREGGTNHLIDRKTDPQEFQDQLGIGIGLLAFGVIVAGWLILRWLIA